MAKDTLLLIQSLGWEKVHIVGVSMGGMISQELVLQMEPENVLSLSLICTHTGGVSNIFPPARGMYFFGKSLLIKELDQMIDNAFNLLYADDQFYHDPERLQYVRDFHTRMVLKKREDPISIWNLLSQLSAIHTHNVSIDQLAKIKNLPCKKLVVSGDKDVLIDYRNSLWIAENIDPYLLIVPNHGHAVQVSYEKELNCLMNDLWEGKGEFANKI